MVARRRRAWGSLKAVGEQACGQPPPAATRASWAAPTRVWGSNKAALDGAVQDPVLFFRVLFVRVLRPCRSVVNVSRGLGGRLLH